MSNLVAAFRTELIVVGVFGTVVAGLSPIFLKRDKQYNFDTKPVNAITANKSISKEMRFFKNRMLESESKNILANLPIEKFKTPTWNAKKPPCVIISCGSYSPPTFLHLRIMEEAKIRLSNEFEIIGGVFSPVHDAYAKDYKPSLKQANMYHRKRMLKLALDSSEWIGVSDFEIKQKGWTRTANVINEHVTALNSEEYIKFLNQHPTKTDNEQEIIPENERKIEIKFLCGSDLLLSFLIPDYYLDEHKEIILQNGVVCIQRKDNRLTDEILQANQLFRDNISNIYLFDPLVENNISSTVVRDLIGETGDNDCMVKYMLPDSVIEYIKENNLYSTDV